MFLYQHKYIRGFSSLHECTFNYNQTKCSNTFIVQGISFFLPPSLFTYFLFSFWSGYRSKKFFSSCSLILINILNIELLPPIRAAEIVGRARLKIWKVWALINHALSQCFRSYRLWSNKYNHRVKQGDINKSTIINQSISMNWFYPIKTLIFIWEFSVFP